MTTATLSSKGQITIPIEVRTELKVNTGDRVEFVQIAPGRYEFVAATRDITELKGLFGPAQVMVTLEDMDAAVAQAAVAAA